MAGRALPSFCFLALLAGGSSAARAENETIAVGEPSPQQERTEAPPAAAPLPKLLGFGKGEDGTHAFLFGRKNGPSTVFLGQAGALQELDVLGMERYPGKFVVDTLQVGQIEFHTTDKSVIIPGDVGFIQKRPTRVMSQTPDKVVFVEALARMGVVPMPVAAATPPKAIAGHLLARGQQLAKGKHGERLRSFSRRLRTRQRATRRPPTRGRVTVRQSAAVH